MAVPTETDQLVVEIVEIVESWCCRNRIPRNQFDSDLHCNHTALVPFDPVAPADNNHTAPESIVDLLDLVRDLKRAPLPRKPYSCCSAVEDRMIVVVDRRMKLDLDHTVLDRDRDLVRSCLILKKLFRTK